MIHSSTGPLDIWGDGETESHDATPSVWHSGISEVGTLHPFDPPALWDAALGVYALTTPINIPCWST